LHGIGAHHQSDIAVIAEQRYIDVDTPVSKPGQIGLTVDGLTHGLGQQPVLVLAGGIAALDVGMGVALHVGGI
jgi:hypothetical protein